MPTLQELITQALAARSAAPRRPALGRSIYEAPKMDGPPLDAREAVRQAVLGAGRTGLSILGGVGEALDQRPRGVPKELTTSPGRLLNLPGSVLAAGASGLLDALTGARTPVNIDPTGMAPQTSFADVGQRIGGTPGALAGLAADVAVPGPGELGTLGKLGALDPRHAAVMLGAVGETPQWLKSRGVFPRDVPEMQGQLPADPRMAGVFEKTPTQQRTGEPRVSELTRIIAESPAVRKGLEEDIEKGLRKGGPEWYNPAPITAVTNPEDFKDFTLIGGAASAQSPVINELVTTGIINFARKRGLTPEEALDVFSQTVYGTSPGLITQLRRARLEGTRKVGNKSVMTPAAESADKALALLRKQRGVNLPMMSGFELDPEGLAKAGSHVGDAQRALAQGILLPTEAVSGSWKRPHYVSMRLGAGGLDPTVAGAFPALDTHEKTRQLQLAMADKNTQAAVLNALRKEGNDVQMFSKGTGVIPKVRQAGKFEMPELTSTNDEYRLLGNLYVDAAKQFGLPTAGAAQASRWLGGGKATGLKSAAEGDLPQIIEDLLAYSAQRRGMSSDPQSLRKYYQRYMQGNDFLVPFTGVGSPPVK